MKRVVLTLICTVAAFVTTAQDRIVLKNAEEVNAKVINISPTTVTYKSWNNIDGPTYTVNKSDVLFVAYSNGTKDVFSNEKSTTSTSFVKFQGYGNLGVIFLPAGPVAGPTLDLTVGALFGEYFYAGFETGFHSLIEDLYFEGYIPIALNLKGYLTKTKVRPFVNVSLGGFVGVADLSGWAGFYCQAGAGIDVKQFSIGLGYSGLVSYGTASSLYFKLGIRFGGNKY